MEVLFDRQGGVLGATFNRPERGNAFNAPMAKMLADKLNMTGKDRSLRAILLCGQGDHFMNGHDLAPYMVMDQETIFNTK